ncbi:MAG: hypothetical protein JWL58_355 [Streptosporangiaceae bacterium]|jgi:hypothetical protein|nr:hypothetical protein [Streptosporangiaceae bacterium]
MSPGNGATLMTSGSASVAGARLPAPVPGRRADGPTLRAVVGSVLYLAYLALIALLSPGIATAVTVSRRSAET